MSAMKRTFHIPLTFSRELPVTRKLRMSSEVESTEAIERAFAAAKLLSHAGDWDAMAGLEPTDETFHVAVSMAHRTLAASTDALLRESTIFLADCAEMSASEFRAQLVLRSAITARSLV